MIVPIGGVSRLAYEALVAAKSLGDDVVAVSVQYGDDPVGGIRADWLRWNPGVPLDVLPSPQRNLVRADCRLRQRADGGHLEAGGGPDPGSRARRRRHQILQNQRGLLLATVLRASTSDVVISHYPLPAHDTIDLTSRRTGG